MKKLTFSAIIERRDYGAAGFYRIVTVPFDIKKEWDKTGQVWLLGSLYGSAFETTLMPNADGSHYVIFNRQNFADAHILGELGDTIEVTIEENPNPRIAILPPDYEEVLEEYPHIKEAFHKLAIGKQAYLVKWIGEVKSLDARANRMAKSLDLIMKWGK